MIVTISDPNQPIQLGAGDRLELVYDLLVSPSGLDSDKLFRLMQDEFLLDYPDLNLTQMVFGISGKTVMFVLKPAEWKVDLETGQVYRDGQKWPQPDKPPVQQASLLPVAIIVASISAWLVARTIAHWKERAIAYKEARLEKGLPDEQPQSPVSQTLTGIAAVIVLGLLFYVLVLRK